MYLVTGGSGFIGSHIVEALVARGNRVRVIDNFVTGRRENLAAVERDIELIVGDLADPETAARAVAGVDGIFHQAALPSVPRSVRDPLPTQHSGEVATLVLLDAAVKAKVRRVLFAASSSAYGNTETLPKVETMPVNPLSPYAASKVACEGYMSAYARCFPIDTASLRYFNVFGPRQDPTSQYSGVIAKFSEVMARGERPTIYGDGETSRDFCYIANAVRANLLAMDRPEPLGGVVMNIGCGRRTTLNQLVELFNRLFGTSLSPKYAPFREGDVQHSLADITRARDLLGYAPTVDVESGLAELLAWNEKTALRVG